MRDGLMNAGPFSVQDAKGDVTMDAAALRDAVRRGEYQVAVIVPDEASEVLEAASAATIAKVFSPADSAKPSTASVDTSVVQVIIDPTVKQAFRGLVNIIWPRCLRRSPATAC
ncbi:MAG: hypothetical protein IPG74_08935 [Flavobacteriales bacterium]|nr:hypothetical protein [Flavobacteriales bacterium]